MKQEGLAYDPEFCFQCTTTTFIWIGYHIYDICRRKCEMNAISIVGHTL